MPKNTTPTIALQPHAFGRTKAVLGACVLLLAAACGTETAPSLPAPEDPGTSQASLLTMIDSAKADVQNVEAQTLKMLRDNNRIAQVELALAPGDLTFTVRDLAPMIESDGERTPVTEGTKLTELADGDLILAPSEFDYSDSTTSVRGVFTQWWVWDATNVRLVKADPESTVTVFEDSGIAVEGTTFNFVLDSTSGGKHDNGQMPNILVEAIDTQADATVVTATTDAQGDYRLENLEPNRDYIIIASTDGFVPGGVTITTAAESSTTFGVFLDLIPRITAQEDLVGVMGTVIDLDGDFVPLATLEVLDAVSMEPLATVDPQASNFLGEYMLQGVDRTRLAGDGVIVHLRRFGVDVYSDPITLPAGSTVDWVNVDFEFPNSGPSVQCIDPASGETTDVVDLLIAPGEEVRIDVVGTDAEDESFLRYSWLKQTDVAKLLLGEETDSEANFVYLPDGLDSYPTSFRVNVQVQDTQLKPGGGCRFNFNVDF